FSSAPPKFFPQLQPLLADKRSMACDPVHQSCPPGSAVVSDDGEPAAVEALSSSPEADSSAFVAAPPPDQRLQALTSPTRVDESRTRVRTALLRAGFVTRQGDRFFLNPAALASWGDLSRMIRIATDAGGLDSFREELAEIEIPRPPQTQGTSSSPWHFLWNLRYAGTPEADFRDRASVYDDALNFVIPVRLMLQRVAGELQLIDEDIDKIAELMVTSLQNAQAASETFAVESVLFRRSYVAHFVETRGADDPIFINRGVLDREVLAAVRELLNREPGSDLHGVTKEELVVAIQRRLDENQAAAPVRLLLSHPLVDAAYEWAQKHPQSIDRNRQQWQLFSAMVDRLLSGYSSFDQIPRVIDVDDLTRLSLCAEIGIHPVASEMDPLFNPLEDAFSLFVRDLKALFGESGETLEEWKRMSAKAYKVAVAEQDQKREKVRRGRVETAVRDYLEEWRAGSRREVTPLDFYAEVRRRASAGEQGWQRVTDRAVRGYFSDLIEPILVDQAPTLLGRQSSKAMTDRAVESATQSVVEQWLRGFNHPISREVLLRQIAGRVKALWGGDISLEAVASREEGTIVRLVREQAPSMVADENYMAPEVEPPPVEESLLSEDDGISDLDESLEPAGFQKLPVKPLLVSGIDYHRGWRRKSRVSQGENPRQRHTPQDLAGSISYRSSAISGSRHDGELLPASDVEGTTSPVTTAPREAEAEVESARMLEGATRLLP
ncbi:MAG: hypothetical protein Q7S98_01905, partial [Deltaproteobacteria bacterium]|nr:hypothetical protein [Deltaproteobacteria bacterium]